MNALWVERHLLRHRRRRSSPGPAPRPRRQCARLPLAADRRERALLAARARRREPFARPDAQGRRTPVRDRGHHARPILRSRSRTGVRRRAAHVRRRPPRGQAPHAEPLGLVALGGGPARPGLDAREGQRAPGRHLQGDFRGVAAGELRRRGRAAVSAHESHRGAGLDRLLVPARGLFRPAVAPARPLRPRAADRVRQHRQPHDRPGERTSARDRRAPRPRRLARAPDPAAARREPRSAARRRSGRRRPRAVAFPRPAGVPRHARHGVVRPDAARPSAARLHSRNRRNDVRPLRPPAGPAGVAHRPHRGHEVGWTRHRRRRRQALGAPSPCRVAGRALARSPGRFAALRAQPAQPALARRRLPARSRPRRHRQYTRLRVPREGRIALRNGCSTACARSPASPARPWRASRRSGGTSGTSTSASRARGEAPRTPTSTRWGRIISGPSARR